MQSECLGRVSNVVDEGELRGLPISSLDKSISASKIFMLALAVSGRVELLHRLGILPSLFSPGTARIMDMPMSGRQMAHSAISAKVRKAT